MLLLSAVAQFIKAVKGRENAVIADCYRRGALINQALPPDVPAPRLQWIEEQNEWVVLGFDAVDGGRMPAEPWQPNDLNATLDAYAYATAAEALAAANGARAEADRRRGRLHRLARPAGRQDQARASACLDAARVHAAAG